MDPYDLTYYEPPYPKKRIGQDYDGGYIMCMMPGMKYDCLLSGGISGDISFEEEFCKLHPNTPCFAYDGTISGVQTNDLNIHFIKKNIGPVETEDTTNLHHVIEKWGCIFLKMDIEGAEIGWLKSLDRKHMEKFAQIVIEFHFPYTEEEKDVFATINKTHILVHLHGNNCCGVRVHNGVVVPNVFECTYLNKKWILPLNKNPIPSPLDMPNIPQNPEIVLDHPPFVST